MTQHFLLAYCRAGFESEAAAELSALTRNDIKATASFPGYASCKISVHANQSASRIYPQSVFARQIIDGFAHLKSIDRKDRLGPIFEAIKLLDQNNSINGVVNELKIADVFVETPDSPKGEELRGFSRSFEAALLGALKKQKRIDTSSPLRLHAFFPDGDECYLGTSEINRSNSWRQGIARLKLPKDAPSRSALKIEEAWLVLMNERERTLWFKAGVTAVDLGAAPGGWTWQLARQSVRVTAIDNGPLREHVMATGLVNHLREDGFRYRPKKSVDWVVCDMVEKPSRVADLMTDWLAKGHARAALFNLKLPMKKRYLEVTQCLQQMQESLKKSGKKFELRAKQLYHDREEITVIALPR